MKTQLIILSLLFIASFAFHQRSRQLYNDKNLYSNQTQSKLFGQQNFTFNQILDHFNYQSQTLWKQRYYVIRQYFNPNVGPVFLYICGEYQCKGVPEARQWVVRMAQRLQGLILVLQHRFYGQSMPFGKNSFKLQNLKYLNSQQALSDLAYFIQQIKVTKYYGVTNNPWITVGGSYPGAMSAWFRYKYPHLTIGAIASSAVVQAIVDFQDYDQQVYVSVNKSGDSCIQVLKKSNEKVQGILNSQEAQGFKKQFQGGQKLSNDQFLFFWVDSFAGNIQYGKRTILCNNLKGKSEEDQFNTLVQLAKVDNQVYQYGAYYISQENSTQRSWMFQCCTQFGFWQTPSDRHPLRPQSLKIDFYKKFCNQSFGIPLWPKAERKNIEYGGTNLQATRLLMVNGVQDPWRWAGLQTSKGEIVSRVANCQNCAHCVQLYTPDSKDSDELKKIRTEQFLSIDRWIQQYWRNKKSINLKKSIEQIY